jgi:hypothetical protein
VVVPEGVTAIGEKAFSDNNTLVSITLLAGITNIGEFAFIGARS